MHQSIAFFLVAAMISLFTNTDSIHADARSIGASFLALLSPYSTTAVDQISLEVVGTSNISIGINTSSEAHDGLQFTEETVDHSLYSRQLFVYGRSSQKRLQQAHVLIIGDNTLAAEVAKNLALAGVGRISFISSSQYAAGGTEAALKLKERKQRLVDEPRLQGSASLSEYTRLLNKYNEVYFDQIEYIRPN